MTEMLSSLPHSHFVWGHTGSSLSMSGPLLADGKQVAQREGV